MSTKIDPFVVTLARGKKVPIVLSVPHCGEEFPPDVAVQVKSRYVERPEDTDWYVDRLFDFAPDLGISMIHARFNRYVVDLNRSPQGEKLYNDDRQQTGLVPDKTFAGEEIYEGPKPDDQEIHRRLDAYYWPYYWKAAQMIEELQLNHKHVLLFDCHSIRHEVPSIRPQRFPHLTLGNLGGKSAHPKLIKTALDELGKNSEGFTVSENDPFEGGQLTRIYGQPHNGIHALQLEMCQEIYMDEDNVKFDGGLADKIRPLLTNVLKALAEQLKTLT